MHPSNIDVTYFDIFTEWSSYLLAAWSKRQLVTDPF